MFLSGLIAPVQQKSPEAAASDYNYAEALQKSIYFYESQRSGELPENNRVQWRGDSGMLDGADVGVDLTGGWYDAGDHVKFGFPMAFTTTMLAWSVYEYEEGFKAAGQLDHMLDNIKWATDYFLKAYTGPTELWGQVGQGSLDHAWWGPAEVMPMDRPAFKIDENCPGSDLAAETAAALASSSIIFRDSDPDYADELLTSARELYDFADQYRGVYSDCITDAQQYYNSWSGYEDEITWGAIWLYLATDEEEYLDKALASVEDWSTEGQTQYWPYKWTIAWDDKVFGNYVLLSRLTDDPRFSEAAERNLNYWSTGIPETGERIHYTPGGLAWLDTWGALRYSSNAAFLAFVYSDIVDDAAKQQQYQEFAESQILYALGNNPNNRSYVVGYGNNPPERPHHRTSHGSWADSQNVPDYHRHTLYGALVGGPDRNDNYEDHIGDYIMNEVAIDYNAGFTGGLARMMIDYGEGQEPLPNFPEWVEPEDEMFVEASINSSGANYTEIRAQLNNRSGWPARMGDKLSFKYFVDLSEVYAAGYTAEDITVTSGGYNQGAEISPLVPYDEANYIYYTHVDFTGVDIYPGGQSAHYKEVQFRISAPQHTSFWDPTNDYSYQGMSGSLAKSPYIPVYDAGELVFGAEPFPPEVPAAPTGLTATAGDKAVLLEWESVAGANYYNIKRASVSGGQYTTVASTNSTSYTDTDLTNDTTYYYVISAVNSAGESDDSAEVSATPEPGPAPSPPTTPAGLQASSGDGVVHLRWQVSLNAEAYHVKRSTTAGGPYETVAEYVADTSYADTDVSNGTTYYYVISAVNAAGESDNSDEVSGMPKEGEPGVPPSGDLVVFYRTTDTNATDSHVRPHFNIVNSGERDIVLEDVTLRYWYTIDGDAPQQFHCDWARIGCGNVSGSFVPLAQPVTGADHYLEIRFDSSAGGLRAGEETGEIQARFNKINWTSYNENNDYSYDGTKITFEEWEKVTLYVGDELVWGIEPE
nr:glycoside hydrolase family 9 protein [Evansella caseinilytica]